MKHHLKKTVLTELKSEQQQTDENALVQLLPKPNLNEFVFFQADKSVNGLVLTSESNNTGAPNDVLDIKSDDQYIMQFKHIHKLIVEKEIHLV
ncbi:unnamed protein product [Rotaria socialis]|nr:unnamed protein product [Rotaria socialis]